MLIDQLDREDFLLSNRIFEDVYAGDRSESDNSAERNENESGSLHAMSEDDIKECISSTGKYVLNRFTEERGAEQNFCLTIPPIINLEDEENKLGSGALNNAESVVTVADLFSHNILIPVIQRDYCMGAQISQFGTSPDFLGYLIDRYNMFKKDSKLNPYIVRKSQRERREYEKKREECDKIKAECEKLKKNLGRIIKHRSIELLKMTFPIEQEKLANKIKQLDEAARQDFKMNPGNDGKQY